MIKIQWLASICVQNDQNVELRRETFKTTQNYKTDQITMNCIDWMSKRSNNAKLQKQLIYNDLHRLYVKMIKIQWLASIWRQNDQNKAKLQKWSKSNDLHRFYVKTIKTVEICRKTFKTTENYKTDQITLNCIDWMVKRSKQS